MPVLTASEHIRSWDKILFLLEQLARFIHALCETLVDRIQRIVSIIYDFIREIRDEIFIHIDDGICQCLVQFFCTFRHFKGSFP